MAFSDAGKAECQPGLDGYQFLNTATDRCYQYVYEKDMRMTWSDARQYCQDKFGRLVNIDDKTKQVSDISIIYNSSLDARAEWNIWVHLFYSL